MTGLSHEESGKLADKALWESGACFLLEGEKMEKVQKSVCFSQEELAFFQAARVGTYFVLPLRAKQEYISGFSLEQCAKVLEKEGWKPYEWEFDDLYQHINDIFSRSLGTDGSKESSVTSAIGINDYIPVEDVMRRLGVGGEDVKEQEFYVITEEERCSSPENLSFRFRCMQIVVMHTGIGFLTIGIEASSPVTHDLLLQAGYNQNRSVLGIVGKPDSRVSFIKLIESLLAGTGMTDFACCLEKNQPESILRDTTTYSVAVIPHALYGDTSAQMKEKLQQLCLNLRYARAFGTDNSEDLDVDSFMNYGSINNRSEKKFIRWGIYTLFERAAQVIFQTGSPVDPINLYGDNREDNYLPFLLIALYERYSYLFFTELLQDGESLNRGKEEWLEEQMLRLKAFGVIMPCDMTPYNNENIFLEEQRKIYEIEESIRLIDDKISIIKHIQSNKMARKMRWAEKMLAAFGIVSIISDSMGVLEALVTDTASPHLYWITFGGEMGLILCAMLVALIVYQKR